MPCQDAEEQAALELKKKRTFRKFTYRGIDLDNLLDLTPDQLVRTNRPRAALGTRLWTLWEGVPTPLVRRTPVPAGGSEAGGKLCLTPKALGAGKGGGATTGLLQSVASA